MFDLVYPAFGFVVAFDTFFSQNLHCPLAPSVPIMMYDLIRPQSIVVTQIRYIYSKVSLWHKWGISSNEDHSWISSEQRRKRLLNGYLACIDFLIFSLILPPSPITARSCAQIRSKIMKRIVRMCRQQSWFCYSPSLKLGKSICIIAAVIENPRDSDRAKAKESDRIAVSRKCERETGYKNGNFRFHFLGFPAFSILREILCTKTNIR